MQPLRVAGTRPATARCSITRCHSDARMHACIHVWKCQGHIPVCVGICLFEGGLAQYHAGQRSGGRASTKQVRFGARARTLPQPRLTQRQHPLLFQAALCPASVLQRLPAAPARGDLPRMLVDAQSEYCAFLTRTEDTNRLNGSHCSARDVGHASGRSVDCAGSICTHCGAGQFRGRGWRCGLLEGASDRLPVGGVR